jgi:hypothetical protein
VAQSGSNLVEIEPRASTLRENGRIQLKGDENCNLRNSHNIDVRACTLQMWTTKECTFQVSSLEIKGETVFSVS